MSLSVFIAAVLAGGVLTANLIETDGLSSFSAEIGLGSAAVAHFPAGLTVPPDESFKNVVILNACKKYDPRLLRSEFQRVRIADSQNLTCYVSSLCGYARKRSIVGWEKYRDLLTERNQTNVAKYSTIKRGRLPIIMPVYTKPQRVLEVSNSTNGRIVKLNDIVFIREHPCPSASDGIFCSLSATLSFKPRASSILCSRASGQQREKAENQADPSRICTLRGRIGSLPLSTQIRVSVGVGVLASIITLLLAGAVYRGDNVIKALLYASAVVLLIGGWWWLSNGSC